MQCRGIRERLDAYLHEEMGADERGQIERHLRVCDECRQALSERRQLGAVLQQASAPPVPPGFAARVMTQARGRAAAREPSRTAWPHPLRWWLSLEIPMRLAAAVVLTVGLGLGTFLGHDTWSSKYADLADAGAATPTEPTIVYGIDFLTATPHGSLAQAYLTLASGQPERGD